MLKIVGACAGRVSTRMNSVCRAPELAGAIESSARAAAKATVVIAYAPSCVGLVNTRTNSVWKELGHVGAIEKRALRLRVSQSPYSLEALEADRQALEAMEITSPWEYRRLSFWASR